MNKKKRTKFQHRPGHYIDGVYNSVTLAPYETRERNGIAGDNPQGLAYFLALRTFSTLITIMTVIIIATIMIKDSRSFA
jgi:hypothetical protein